MIDDEQAENWRQMFVAITDDCRIIIAKVGLVCTPERMESFIDWMIKRKKFDLIASMLSFVDSIE